MNEPYILVFAFCKKVRNSGYVWSLSSKAIVCYLENKCEG